MHVAYDLKTQNTVLHIMHFLCPRVAKAPYIFESQLIILIQQSRHSFILLIFLHFLCFFAHVAFIFSYFFFFLLYFSKAASFNKRHSDQKNRFDEVHFLKTIGVSLKKYGSFLLLCFMSHCDYLYTSRRLNIILSYLFQALDFLYVKLSLVHKRRKRKSLISQFLQSRDRGFN